MSELLPGPRILCRLEVLPGARVLDRLQHAAAYGFDGIALPGRYLDRYLGELRTCLPDSPLPLEALSLGFVGSLVSSDAGTRQACRDSLLHLFDLCAELRVPRFNMPPLLFQDNPGSAGDPSRLAELTETRDAWLLVQLPALAEAAQQRGVTLLLEPVNRYE
ncbi:MAG: sugar phosphate isomerase/epimerase family protein, partial [Acetobacteraceae bacterium]